MNDIFTYSQKMCIRDSIRTLLYMKLHIPGIPCYCYSIDRRNLSCNTVPDSFQSVSYTHLLSIDLHGNRHGQKHSMMLLFQKFSDFPGSSLCEQAPLGRQSIRAGSGGPAHTGNSRGNRRISEREASWNVFVHAGSHADLC